MTDANLMQTLDPGYDTDGTSDGLVSWYHALDYIAGMNGSIHPNYGYTEWRLPNRVEALSLLDFNQHRPPLPENHPFSEPYGWNANTATTSAADTTMDWIVILGDRGYSH